MHNTNSIYLCCKHFIYFPCCRHRVESCDNLYLCLCRVCTYLAYSFAVTDAEAYFLHVCTTQRHKAPNDLKSKKQKAKSKKKQKKAIPLSTSVN